MRLRCVESGEGVEDRVDLGCVEDAVPEAEEDVLDLAPDLRDQVEPPAQRPLARKRDVEGLDFLVRLRGECRLALRKRLLDRRTGRVQSHPRLTVANLAEREL